MAGCWWWWGSGWRGGRMGRRRASALQGLRPQDLGRERDLRHRRTSRRLSVSRTRHRSVEDSVAQEGERPRRSRDDAGGQARARSERDHESGQAARLKQIQLPARRLLLFLRPSSSAFFFDRLLRPSSSSSWSSNTTPAFSIINS